MTHDPTAVRDAAIARGLSPATQLDDRTLFHYALNSDEFPELLPTMRSWVDAHLEPAPSDEGGFEALVSDLHALRRRRVAEATSLAAVARDASLDTCRHVLRQYAPTALVDGCILQYAVGISINHTAFGSRVLRLYSREVGDGVTSRHHGAHYRDLLRSVQLALPEVAAESFVDETRLSGANLVIDGSAFQLALFGAALSHFPRSLLPEITGAALYYYAAGVPPLLLALRGRLREFDANVRFLEEHVLAAEPAGDPLLEDAVEAARSLVAGTVDFGRPDPACVARVRRGLASAAAIESRFHERLVALVRAGGLSARAKMERLVKDRAPQIAGYHKKSVRLEKLMVDAVERPGAVVDWLAKSRFIVAGDADASPFFRELTAFGGPMFRAFSVDELAVIRDWVNQLSTDGAGSDAGGAERTSFTTFVEPEPAIEPKSLHEAYHHLINFEPSLGDRAYAKAVVEKWLAVGEVLSRGRCAETEPFEPLVEPLSLDHYALRPYSSAVLDAAVDAQHRAQVELYLATASAKRPPPKRDRILQFFYAVGASVLADGAWLQRAILTATSHNEIHARLFRIYSDELGNGDPVENHCNVCRRTLEEGGLHVPDMRDPKFGIEPPVDIVSAFVPAIYTMSISLFPKRYFPELLGLNLAIELFGVGGQFRMQSDAFKAAGLNPLFWDLHNTIDNVGTGHSAWAKEAIRLYMDDMLAKGGDDLAAGMWRRVWTGYCSWSALDYMVTTQRRIEEAKRAERQ
jgi:hypothetical protein